MDHVQLKTFRGMKWKFLQNILGIFHCSYAVYRFARAFDTRYESVSWYENIFLHYIFLHFTSSRIFTCTQQTPSSRQSKYYPNWLSGSVLENLRSSIRQTIANQARVVTLWKLIMIYWSVLKAKHSFVNASFQLTKNLQKIFWSIFFNWQAIKN